MEMVGRFPSDEEANQFDIEKTTPVWLPTEQEFPQFTQDVRSQLTLLRNAIMTSILL